MELREKAFLCWDSAVWWKGTPLVVRGPWEVISIKEVAAKKSATQKGRHTLHMALPPPSMPTDPEGRTALPEHLLPLKYCAGFSAK